MQKKLTTCVSWNLTWFGIHPSANFRLSEVLVRRISTPVISTGSWSGNGGSEHPSTNDRPPGRALHILPTNQNPLSLPSLMRHLRPPVWGGRMLCDVISSRVYKTRYTSRQPLTQTFTSSLIIQIYLTGQKDGKPSKVSRVRETLLYL